MDKHYVVSAFNRGGKFQNNYMDSLDEAKRLFSNMIGRWDFVEILYGTFGHYESIKTGGV